MTKAILVLENITDETLRAVMADNAVIGLLILIAIKHKLNAVYIGTAQSVPSDLHHKLREPIFSLN